jgi:hypothetical protein
MQRTELQKIERCSCYTRRREVRWIDLKRVEMRHVSPGPTTRGSCAADYIYLYFSKQTLTIIREKFELWWPPWQLFAVGQSEIGTEAIETGEPRGTGYAVTWGLQ